MGFSSALLQACVVNVTQSIEENNRQIESSLKDTANGVRYYFGQEASN